MLQDLAKLLDFYRLQKIIAHPQIHGTLRIGKIRIGAQDHSLACYALFPELFQHGKAIHIRHPYIHNDNIRFFPPDNLKPLQPITRLTSQHIGRAQLLQDFFHALTYGGFILNYHNSQ